MDGPSAQALEHLGINTSLHRGRQFEPWMAAHSDLVLTATREHRDAVITEVPAAFRRVFTMKEFARLVWGMTPADPREIVAAAAAQRGQGGPVPLEHDDVLDPYRRDLAYAKAIAEEIGETVYATVSVLGFAAESWQHPQPARPERLEDARPRPY